MKKKYLLIMISFLLLPIQLFALRVDPAFIGSVIQLGAQKAYVGIVTIKPKNGKKVFLTSYNSATTTKLGEADLPEEGLMLKFDDGYLGDTWYIISCKVDGKTVNCQDVVTLEDASAKVFAGTKKDWKYKPLYMQR